MLIEEEKREAIAIQRPESSRKNHRLIVDNFIALVYGSNQCNNEYRWRARDIPMLRVRFYRTDPMTYGRTLPYENPKNCMQFTESLVRWLCSRKKHNQDLQADSGREEREQSVQLVKQWHGT